MAALATKDTRVPSLPVLLKPSPTLIVFWALLSLGAGMCIFYSDLPLLAQIPLGLVLLYYSSQVLWQDILLRVKELLWL